MRDICTSLAQLFKAGLGPVTGLETLAGTSSGWVQRELKGMMTRLEAGDTLAEAARGAPRLFRPSDRVILGAFEEVGDPGGGFAALAVRAAGAIEVRRQLIRQSAYPLIVLISHFIISPLPKLVLGSGRDYAVSVLQNLGILVGLLVVAVWVVPVLLRAGLSQVLMRAAWRLPWPATIWVAHTRAVFNRTLGRNLGAGLELFRALRSAAAATGDPVVIERSEHMLPAVSAEGLAQPVARAGLVGRGELMLAVSAERAGTLDETLALIAGRYEEVRRRGLRWLMTGLGALLTVAVVAVVALNIVGAYRNTMGTADRLMEQLDGPMRDLPQLEGLDLREGGQWEREVPLRDLP